MRTALCRWEVDEELAYQMTKQLFENLPELIAAHNAAEGIDPKTAGKNLPVPLHPGAARYYEEKGIDIPEALRPTQE